MQLTANKTTVEAIEKRTRIAEKDQSFRVTSDITEDARKTLPLPNRSARVLRCMSLFPAILRQK